MNPETLLTHLDPSPLENHLSDRARQDLHTITSTLPISTKPAPRRILGIRRRPAALIGTAAATVCATVALTIGPGGGQPAFASWTAIPQALSRTSAQTAITSCTKSLATVGYRKQSSDIALAERRGQWNAVQVTRPDGYSGTCINGPDGGATGVGTVGNAFTPPPARGVSVSDVGALTLQGHESMTNLGGLAGNQVSAITIHTPSKGDVTATVQNGAFFAWWPGDDFTAELHRADATLHFRDGTTRTLRLRVNWDNTKATK